MNILPRKKNDVMILEMPGKRRNFHRDIIKEIKSIEKKNASIIRRQKRVALFGKLAKSAALVGTGLIIGIAVNKKTR